MQRLKGYAEVKIVGMRYHYKSSDGQRLPNPRRGCPVSLQLEPSNPYHHNAIKVINEIDTRHLGYIVREIADILTLLLKDNIFASARAILSVPPPHCRNLEVISCQVLLFFAVPCELVPPLPPQLGFHEDLSSPNFVLADTPVAFAGCTLHDYDSYKARCMVSLHLQPPLRPCSTNTNSPVHACHSDAIAPSEPPPQFQTQNQAGTQSEVQDTAQTNEVTCMKCKQTGRGSFFQCAESRCPVLVHESCIAGVVGRTCLFCLFLACRGERLRAKTGSDLYVTPKAKYEEARKSAIQFFGKETFMRLRELAGLDPLLPTQVQLPCNANMQCYTEEVREREAVGTSTIIEKSASKEKKEKVVGCDKRRLPPRLSLDRACKKRIEASSLPCQLVQGHGLETN